MSREKRKVYIYTRVSTSMQIDGYSLDAQKSRMKAFCDFNDYEIAGEYEDAGKSGKTVEGRVAFNQIMEDIKTGKDEVSFVFVFKLSRFVAEVIRTLVSNKKFAEMMKQKINMEVDTSALDQEIANYERQLRQCFANRDSIMADLDSIDYEDKHYRRRKADLEERLYKTYDKIEEMEVALVVAKAKKRSILSDKISGDNIYKARVFFDRMYDNMNEAERREFIEQLIERVEVYEERQPKRFASS